MPTPTTHTHPAWTVRAWSPLLWQVSAAASLQMEHLGTQITRAGGAGGSTLGQTVWAFCGNERQAAMAWDWIHLARGIVAMADPMSVVTNLTLVGPEGEPLTELECARHLNGIVHRLPWQDEVERVMAEQRLLQ